MKDALEDIAKWDREDAANDRLIEMRLTEFEYVDQTGKTRNVKRFGTMFSLLRSIVQWRYCDNIRDLTDEEVALAMGVGVKTVQRTIADCVGRGLLTVERLERSKRRYEIRWSQVDQANPNFKTDDDINDLERLP